MTDQLSRETVGTTDAAHFVSTPPGRSELQTTEDGSQAGGVVSQTRKDVNMRDSGSMIEIEDHYRALGRAYDVADQLSTLRLMRRESECVVLDNMARFGGQFVKSLAIAARCADLTNYERLKNAFPHYWESFSEERCVKYQSE